MVLSIGTEKRKTNTHIRLLLLFSKNNTEKERDMFTAFILSYRKQWEKGRREGRLKHHQKIKRIPPYKMPNEQKDMKTKKDKTPKTRQSQQSHISTSVNQLF